MHLVIRSSNNNDCRINFSTQCILNIAAITTKTICMQIKRQIEQIIKATTNQNQFCAILCKYLMIIGGYLNNNNFNVHIFYVCYVVC